MTSLQGEIDQLADFLFMRNTNNNVVDIQIDGISDMNDMFMFCIDLLYKGIMMMIGKQSETINIDEISFQDFKMIQDKMQLGGIKVNSNYVRRGSYLLQEYQQLPFPSKCIVVEKPAHSSQGKSLTLSMYHLIICSEKAVYDISFEAIHSLQQKCNIGKHCS